jgi:hypothetical protein
LIVFAFAGDSTTTRLEPPPATFFGAARAGAFFLATFFGSFAASFVSMFTELGILPFSS